MCLKGGPAVHVIGEQKIICLKSELVPRRHHANHDCMQESASRVYGLDPETDHWTNK